jgi:hypothetical protein
MTETLRRQKLITNAWVAAIGVILTGYSAVDDFRDAFFSRVSKPTAWLLPFNFGLPKWALLVANIVFYGHLVWLGVTFFRITQSKERIVVVGWFLAILLYPVEVLFSNHAAVAIRYVDATAMGAAFLALLHILLKLLIADNAQS